MTKQLGKEEWLWGGGFYGFPLRADVVKDEAKNNIPIAQKQKKIWLINVAIYIADKRREAKNGQARGSSSNIYFRSRQKKKRPYFSEFCCWKIHGTMWT